MKVIVATDGRRYTSDGLRSYRIEDGRLFFEYAGQEEIFIEEEIPEDKTSKVINAVDGVMTGPSNLLTLKGILNPSKVRVT